MWTRIEVTGWETDRVEQSGTSEARWLSEPGTGTQWLHKDTKIPSNGVEQGEDWAEVVSTEVARRLGLPCAATQLCLRDGRRGSISRSVRLPQYDHWEGAVVMASIPGFIPHVEGQPRASDPGRPGIRRPGHSIANIRTVLHDVHAPPGFGVPAGVTGFDVFAGYLVLDALIANADRHEHNWALLVPQLLALPTYLSPSYDHASSLGRNLRDSKRQHVLNQRGGVEPWAHKGRAVRFEHVDKPKDLVAHAHDALGECSAMGAQWLVKVLADVDLEPVHAALRSGAVPDMSEAAGIFASELLTVNLRRLRDAFNAG